MANNERIDRGFLGEAVVRLGRLLDLAGLVTPQYNTDEKIVPVVILGDGTTPGMGSQRQRHFGVCGTIANGGQVCHFMASRDVVIERLRFDHEVFAVNTQILLSYKGPADALGAEILGGTLTGAVLDRGNQSEVAPLVQLVGGTAGSRWARGNLQAADSSWEVVGEFFLQQGARVIVVPTGVGSTITFSIFGRTF